MNIFYDIYHGLLHPYLISELANIKQEALNKFSLLEGRKADLNNLAK